MATIGQEFLSSNLRIAFPFVENAEGLSYNGTISHGLAASMPIDAIVDACISLPYTSSVIYLDSIARHATEDRYVIIFTNGSDAILTYDLAGKPTITGYYAVIEMRNESSGAVVKLVVTQAFNDYLTAIPAGVQDRFQQGLQFENIVVMQSCPHVTGLLVGMAGVTGDIVLEAGYNTAIGLVKDGYRDIANIIIGFSPGSGMGLYPCQETVSAKIPVGLIPTPDGEIKIESGDECYAVVPHPGTGQLELQGNCYPCCSCDMYKNIGNALKDLAARAMTAKNILSNIHTKMTTSITDYNLKIPGREIEVSVGGSRGELGSASYGYLTLTAINHTHQDMIVNESDMVIDIPPGIVLRRKHQDINVMHASSTRIYMWLMYLHNAVLPNPLYARITVTYTLPDKPPRTITGDATF